MRTVADILTEYSHLRGNTDELLRKLDKAKNAGFKLPELTTNARPDELFRAASVLLALSPVNLDAEMPELVFLEGLERAYYEGHPIFEDAQVLLSSLSGGIN